MQEAARAQRLLGPYSRIRLQPSGADALLRQRAGVLVARQERRTVDDPHAARHRRHVRRARRRARRPDRVAAPRRGERRWASWCSSSAPGLEWFRDPWSAYVVILPIVLALVAGAALVDASPGRRWRAVVLVVAGSFAVQSHIGAVPLVVLALAARCRRLRSVGVATRHATSRRRSTRRSRSPSVLVCWALPIWDQVAERGNLHLVGAFATSGSGHAELRHRGAPGRARRHARCRSPRQHLRSAAIGRRAAGGPGRVRSCWSSCSLPRPRTRRGRGDVRSSGWPRSASPCRALRWSSWSRRCGSRAPSSRTCSRSGSRSGRSRGSWRAPRSASCSNDGCSTTSRRSILATTVVVVGVAALAVSGRAFDRPSESFGSRVAADLQQGIDEICATGRPVQIVSSSAPWFEIGEVGAALGECAPEVRFDPALELLVGERRTGPLADDDVITVRFEHPGVPIEPGWRRVARTHGATLDVRP